MRKTHEQIKLYMTMIRRLMVAKRDMSLTEMAEQFARNELPLDKEYISKLREKVIRERTHRLNRVFLNYRLAEQDDARREILTQAWDIVLHAESKSQKLAAMHLIISEEHNWTNLLVDLGVFNKGDDRAKRFIPASEEKIAEMIKAFGAHLGPDAPEVKYLDAVVQEIKPPQNDKPTATTEKPSDPNIRILGDGSSVQVRFGLANGQSKPPGAH